jgi:hypothetical protein
MDKIEKVEPNTDVETTELSRDSMIRVQQFQSFLQKPPAEKEVRSNKFANNSKYLPISFMEMTLDEIFFGLWQTRNFKTMNIANEIVGEIELWVFHPIVKTWLCRVGAGAVQIQMKSVEKGGSGDITNIKDKIVNTLSKDYPHLKAECFRNACLSIGKMFGRDLNREFDDQYVPPIKAEIINPLNEMIQKIIDKLDSYEGDNKEAIRSMCAEKQQAGEFTEEFARNVAGQLGLEL